VSREHVITRNGDTKHTHKIYISHHWSSDLKILRKEISTELVRVGKNECSWSENEVVIFGYSRACD
jgi:hypothetical protein